MSDSKPGKITPLFEAWRAGEPGAEERLFALLYDELRRLAAYHLRGEGPAQVLDTGSLVHEVYLRLVGQRHVPWKNRGHFLAIASRAMRRILVDRARRRNAAKRGGGLAPSPLDSVVLAMSSSVDVVDLHRALEKLESLDPRAARVVELRFFAGLTVPEVAQAIGVSRATVEREWVAARAWLRRELDDADETNA